MILLAAIGCLLVPGLLQQPTLQATVAGNKITAT